MSQSVLIGKKYLKMSTNPAKYEVLIQQYLRSILDISVFMWCYISYDQAFLKHFVKIGPQCVLGVLCLILDISVFMWCYISYNQAFLKPLVKIVTRCDKWIKMVNHLSLLAMTTVAVCRKTVTLVVSMYVLANPCGVSRGKYRPTN